MVTASSSERLAGEIAGTKKVGDIAMSKASCPDTATTCTETIMTKTNTLVVAFALADAAAVVFGNDRCRQRQKSRPAKREKPHTLHRLPSDCGRWARQKRSGASSSCSVINSSPQALRVDQTNTSRLSETA